jgi:cell division protein FtsN
MRKMKKLAGLIFPFVVILLLPSCTPKEATKDNTPKKDTVYVFDRVAPDTVVKQVYTPPVETPTYGTPHYFVQIGAFSTRDKAESFSATAKQKLNHEFVIKFNEDKKLYTVQVSPPYTSRPEAEKVRDDIKQVPEYSDAWIVTVEK